MGMDLMAWELLVIKYMLDEVEEKRIEESESFLNREESELRKKIVDHLKGELEWVFCGRCQKVIKDKRVVYPYVVSSTNKIIYYHNECKP